MRSVLLAMVWLVAGFSSTAQATDLPPNFVEKLEKEPYVYISSTRASGNLGSAAEIWFAWQDGTVLVGTSTNSYRVRRIRAGRPAARIWLEKSHANWFDATGKLVDDAATQEFLMTDFARKYGDSFKSRWEESFRKGFLDGSRVVVRYTPTGKTGEGPLGLPAKK